MWPLLALACGSAPDAPLAAPPEAAELEGVRVESTVDGWVATAASATVEEGAPVLASAVTATLPSGDAPPIQVTATTTEWDLRARVARLSGSVTVTRGPVTMRCERVEVRYGPGQRIDRITADGGVHVESGARTASAGHAEVDGKTGQIVLTGAPALTDGESRLAGDTLTLYLDDERVVCSSLGGGPCHLTIAGDALPVAIRPKAPPRDAPAPK